MVKDLKDKIAVVTGAGSGIGRALALSFAKRGMRVVVVDINPESLETVSREIEKIGAEVMSKVVDVSDREQMSQLAEDTYQRFGKVNVLCNNAGIGTGGLLSEVHLENWDWIIGVNLYGVIYGVHFFLKRMIESGEEGHIVNTSSMAGLLSTAQECLYSVTKFGVVGLSEGLSQQLQLQDSKVGVSVLCPGFIDTNIMETSQSLAEKQSGLYQFPEEMQEFLEPVFENFRNRIKHGMDPDVVAQMVINSIQENRLYIITHPDFLQFVDMRARAINHDAIELKEVMLAQGIGEVKTEIKSYTHRDPSFTISYPAGWVEQKPTPMMSFDFMAASDVWFPSLVVRTWPVPPGGLNGSIEHVAKTLSESMGMENKVISETQTKLKAGLPAMEGEIEMQLLDKANQLIYLVLAAIKEDKLISIALNVLKPKYDSKMKQSLRDIAYTLTFD